MPEPINNEEGEWFTVAVDVKKLYHIDVFAKDIKQALDKANALQSTYVEQEGDQQDVETIAYNISDDGILEDTVDDD